MSSYSRLVRFIPQSVGDSGAPLIGEPVDRDLDVGLAMRDGRPVEVDVVSGQSVLAPGQKTGSQTTIARLLSPLAPTEVGTIRCIGLNSKETVTTGRMPDRQYMQHAKEVKLDAPTVPTLFMKPATALNDPFPARVVIPRALVADDAADYESELAVVIGKTCKDVSEADAMDHVAGYTAANDISSRKAQFAQSQWCFSKSFDGACPLGPAFVPRDQVADIGAMKIRGAYNGDVVQSSGLDDLIFSVPKIVSFLSQGTTLLPGTVIITGTPAGVGYSAEPRRTLRHGDEFSVYVSHGVGTLVNQIEEER